MASKARTRTLSKLQISQGHRNFMKYQHKNCLPLKLEACELILSLFNTVWVSLIQHENLCFFFFFYQGSRIVFALSPPFHYIRNVKKITYHRVQDA
jgi:hypothetical protein